MAQLGSAPAWGAGGRRFKSSRSDHFPRIRSVPLLTFAMGRRAVAVPASLAISTAVILRNIKALAIGAVCSRIKITVSVHFAAEPML